MPTRLIRDGINASDRVNLLTAAEEVFYRRLLSAVDDHGTFDGRPGILRTTLFPLRVDTVTENHCAAWASACEVAGLIVLYQTDGKPLLQVLDTRWQVRSKPKHPLPTAEQLQASVNRRSQPFTPVYLDVVVDVDVDVDVGAVVGTKLASLASPAVVPLVSKGKPQSVPTESARGTRIKKDWMLPKEWGEWALGQRPDWTPEHVRAVADAFRDHFVSTTRNATKLDWEATWRNWVRNETKRPAGRIGGLSAAGSATAANLKDWVPPEERGKKHGD